MFKYFIDFFKQIHYLDKKNNETKLQKNIQK